MIKHTYGVQQTPSTFKVKNRYFQGRIEKAVLEYQNSAYKMDWITFLQTTHKEIFKNENKEAKKQLESYCRIYIPETQINKVIRLINKL